MIPGEIRMLYFPFVRNSPEPFKLRPVLILGVLRAPTPNDAILVVMITGNGQRLATPGPGDIVLTDWQRFGLRKPSTLRCRRVFSADGSDFPARAPLGRVDQDLLNRARLEVGKLLNL